MEATDRGSHGLRLSQPTPTVQLSAAATATARPITGRVCLSVCRTVHTGDTRRTDTERPRRPLSLRFRRRRLLEAAEQRCEPAALPSCQEREGGTDGRTARGGEETRDSVIWMAQCSLLNCCRAARIRSLCIADTRWIYETMHTIRACICSYSCWPEASFWTELNLEVTKK